MPRPPERRGDFASQLERAGSTPSAREVAASATRLSGEQAASALGRAWRERFGHSPTRPTLSVLTAQWAHETGRGRSMMNFNFGGIKGTGPSGLSAVYGTREGHGASERHVEDGFRAYHSAAEGASDYLNLLARRYPQAIEAADRGDPAAFVRSLHEGGYFTASPESYQRSVTLLARQALEEGFSALGAAEPGAAAIDLASPPAGGGGPGGFSTGPMPGAQLGALLLQSASRGATDQSTAARAAFPSSSDMDRIALLMAELPTMGWRAGEDQGR